MTVIWLLWLPFTLAAPKIFPLVDPGLFVISGVKTCGEGGGYCLLGLDCTLDEDFLPDNGEGQHCEGLRSAFTPSAHFVCCRAANKTAYKPPTAFPSSPSSPSTARTTARTTLNVLENEIDQVLHKVAQSVDSVKKVPVTEPILPIVDDSDQSDEPESHISIEDNAEEELDEEEQEEEMVADSPIEEMAPEEEDGSTKDSDSMLEANNDTMSEQSEETPDNDSPATVNLNQLPKIEEYIIDKNSEENTINPAVVFDPEDSEEQDNNKLNTESKNEYDNSEESIPQDSSMNTENALEENSSNPTEQNNVKIDLNNIDSTDLESEVPAEETKENTQVDGDLKEATPHLPDVILKLPIPPVIHSPSYTSVDNNNIVKTTENSIANKENVDDDLNEQVTPLSETNKNVMNEGESADNSNGETKLTNVQSNSDMAQEENAVQNNDNPNSIDFDNENLLEPVTGNENTSSVVQNTQKVNDTKQLSDQTTEPGDNQSDTVSTVSPDTQVSNNIGPSVIQPQPASTDPCAKVTDGVCTQEVKFVSNGQTLCFGSVYALDWVVTSASCALRIFRTGMLNVIVSPLTEMSKANVKTIIVHESYAENSGASGQGMEANNIGLVRLQSPMVEWSRCVPCLPEAGKEFTGVNCSAVTSQPLAPTLPHMCAMTENCETARSENTVNSCDGPSRMMRDDLGFPYITLNCDILWEPRFFDPSSRGSGAPLFCEGLLAGVETGAGVGLMVYTPLSPYMPWLLRNTHPPQQRPEQTFNIG